MMRQLIVPALLLCLAGCGGGEAPRAFTPLSYDYLPKIAINAAHIDADANWVPVGDAEHVENLAPTPPAVALRLMAEQRLLPSANSGEVRFAVTDASIVRVADNYHGHFGVTLEVTQDDGSRKSISVEVRGTHEITGTDPASVRSNLDALTRSMMDEMNVEFEYQIRHQLGSPGASTSPNAPAGAVQSEDLTPPPNLPKPPPGYVSPGSQPLPPSQSPPAVMSPPPSFLPGPIPLTVPPPTQQP